MSYSSEGSKRSQKDRTDATRVEMGSRRWGLDFFLRRDSSVMFKMARQRVSGSFRELKGMEVGDFTCYADDDLASGDPCCDGEQNLMSCV